MAHVRMILGLRAVVMVIWEVQVRFQVWGWGRLQRFGVGFRVSCLGFRVQCLGSLEPWMKASM